MRPVFKLLCIFSLCFFVFFVTHLTALGVFEPSFFNEVFLGGDVEYKFFSAINADKEFVLQFVF